MLVFSKNTKNVTIYFKELIRQNTGIFIVIFVYLEIIFLDFYNY